MSIKRRLVLFAVAVVAVCLLGITYAPAACSTSHMRALAQEQANSMARRDSMDHAGFLGRAHRGARAENVAYGVSNEAAAIAMWWRSPGHAANMRLPGCRGVASAVSRSGRRYWAMEIGD